MSEHGGYFGEPWTDPVITEWLLSVQVQLAAASASDAPRLSGTANRSSSVSDVAASPAGRSYDGLGLMHGGDADDMMPPYPKQLPAGALRAVGTHAPVPSSAARLAERGRLARVAESVQQRASSGFVGTHQQQGADVIEPLQQSEPDALGRAATAADTVRPSPNRAVTPSLGSTGNAKSAAAPEALATPSLGSIGSAIQQAAIEDWERAFSGSASGYVGRLGDAQVLSTTFRGTVSDRSSPVSGSAPASSWLPTRRLELPEAVETPQRPLQDAPAEHGTVGSIRSEVGSSTVLARDAAPDPPATTSLPEIGLTDAQWKAFASAVSVAAQSAQVMAPLGAVDSEQPAAPEVGGGAVLQGSASGSEWAQHHSARSTDATKSQAETSSAKEDACADDSGLRSLQTRGATRAQRKAADSAELSLNAAASVALSQSSQGTSAGGIFKDVYWEGGQRKGGTGAEDVAAKAVPQRSTPGHGTPLMCHRRSGHPATLTSRLWWD